MVHEEEEQPDINHDTDNVSFINPKKLNDKGYQALSQYIEAEVRSQRVDFEEDEWTPADNSKFNHSQNISRVNQSLKLDTTKDLTLITSWNLPQSTVNEYKRKGVERIFDWQSECLQNPKVLFEGLF